MTLYDSIRQEGMQHTLKIIQLLQQGIAAEEIAEN